MIITYSFAGLYKQPIMKGIYGTEALNTLCQNLELLKKNIVFKTPYIALSVYSYMYKVFKCGTFMETVSTISRFILLKKKNYIFYLQCINSNGEHQKLSQCSLFSMLETVLVENIVIDRSCNNCMIFFNNYAMSY